MICESPHRSNPLLPRWIAPCLLPWLLSPWPAPAAKDPVHGQRWLSNLWQMWKVHGFFSPGGKNQIFRNGRIVLSEPHFPFWEQVLLLAAKRGRTALSEPRSRGPVTCQELQTLRQRPGRKQEEAEARTARWSLVNTPCGRPRTKQIVLKK